MDDGFIILWLVMGFLAYIGARKTLDVSSLWAFIIAAAGSYVATIVLYFLYRYLTRPDEPEEQRLLAQLEADQEGREVRHRPVRATRRAIAETENGEAKLYELTLLLEDNEGNITKGDEVDRDVIVTIRPAADIGISGELVGQDLTFTFELIDPSGMSQYDSTFIRTLKKNDNIIMPDTTVFPIDQTTPLGTWRLVIWIDQDVQWANVPFEVFKLDERRLRKEIGADMAFNGKALNMAKRASKKKYDNLLDN